MEEKFGPFCSPAHTHAWSVASDAMRTGAFFEAHEHYESLFRDAVGDARTFFQALAQLAASHHQLTLGRARAAVRTWHKARTKLAALGLLSDDLALAMQRFHAELAIDAEGPRFIELSRLPARVTFPYFEAGSFQTPSA